MKKQIIPLIILFGLILSLNFALADPNPPGGPPKIFSGSVYVNGALLNDGSYTLTAWIGSSAVAQTTVSNGKYSNLQVSTSNNYGTITFVVNGVQANEVSSWNNDKTSDWGQKVTLNLNLSSKPPKSALCGNGPVDLGEECDGLNLAGRTSCGSGWTGTISCSSTCVIEYSNCTKVQETTTTSSSSSSGGSSSGGSSSGGSSPSKSSSSSSSSSSSGGKSNSNTSSNLSVEKLNEEKTTSTNFFTGFITGVGDFAKTGLGMGVLVGVFIIAGTAVFFTVKRKGKKSKKEGK
jgi:hypothetical protein